MLRQMMLMPKHLPQSLFAIPRTVVVSLLVLAIVLMVEPSQSKGQSQQDKERSKPTVAFVDVDRSSQGALLEARLLSHDAARWLERTEIDQVLREQKLESLFNPGAAAGRCSLGKLLKADLLILLRRRTDPKPHFSLVVCQTATGLRLCVESLAVTDKPAEAAAALERIALRGIRKHTEKVREICAIPPFVSQDLTRDHDHLKAAYAKLIEQALLSSPGLLVVEFEEAQAVAKELRLTAETVRRPLPLYVLGEYRHTGRGDARTVRVGVKIVRGDSELATLSKTNLSPQAATQFVRQECVAALRQVIGERPQKNSAAEIEAEQLAERAEVFLKLGEWQESLALIEASLLLQPGQAELHHDAIVALTELVRNHWTYGEARMAEMTLGLSYYRRGLQHLELFLGLVNDVSKYQTSPGAHFIGMFRGASNTFVLHPKTPPEIQQLATELSQFQRDVLLRLIRQRAQSGSRAPFDHFLFYWSLDGLSEKEKWSAVLKTLEELQHFPGAAQRTRAFVRMNFTAEMLDTPDGRDLLEKLAQFENPETKSTAQALQRETAAFLAARKAPTKPPPGSVKPSGPQLVEFRKVEVVTQSLQGKMLPPPHIERIVAAGQGIDIAWSGSSVFVMKSKGLWRQLAVSPVNTLLTHVGFDGKFIWVSGYSQVSLDPVLLVLDPVSEQVWPITAQDGLPTEKVDQLPKGTQQKLAVAPLEPGRALLIGAFGRTWFGTVRFSPQQGASVKVFHEAREVADPENKPQGQSTNVAFTPTFAFTLRNPAKSPDQNKFRVLVGRSTPRIPQIEVMTHPVVVNPDDETVVVHPEYLSGETPLRELTWHQDSVYAIRSNARQHQSLDLVRIPFPGMTQELVLSDVREGRIIPAEDRVHFVGYHWWDQSLPDGTIRCLHDHVPWRYLPRWGASRNHVPMEIPPRPLQPEEASLQFAGHSQHFGLLVVTSSTQRGIEYFQAITTADDVQKTK